MFIPLRTDSPSKYFPAVNIGIIVVCSIVFVVQAAMELPELVGFINSYGLFDKGSNFTDYFTHMFLHGGWLHVIGNMLFLWVFGNAINSAIGNLNYFILYIALGVFAGFGHTMIDPGPVKSMMGPIPLIGASGAISGVVGAFLALNARDDVKVMVWLLPFSWVPVIGKLPGLIFVGFYFVENLVLALYLSDESLVAYWVHVFGLLGGFAVGMGFLQMRLIPPTQWDFYALFRPKPKLALVVEDGDYKVVKDDPYEKMRQAPAASGTTIVRVQTQPPPPAPPQEQPLTKESALQELSAAVASQNRLRAKELYKLLLQLDPETPIPDNVIVQVASYFYLEGKHVESVRVYRRLLEKFPSSDHLEEAMFRLAFIHQHHLRDKEQAVACYSAYVQRYPQGRFAEQANKEMKMLIPKKS